jgi:hypothetical protein
MSFRPSVFRVAVVAVVLIGAYSAVWFYEANRLRTGLVDFVAARAAKSVIVGSDEPEIGGYPFSLEARFNHVAVEGLPYLPQAHIDALRLIAWARPWQPESWRFEAPAGFSLALPRADTVITFGSGRGRAIAQYGDGGSLIVEIDAHDLTDATSGGAPIAAGHLALRLELPNKPPDDHTAESLGIAATLDKVVLPSTIQPLGSEVDQVSIDAAIEGTIPAAGALPLALATWRDHGGTVELRQLRFQYGTLRLTGSGTVALDQALQPIGAFSAEIRDWQKGLEAVAASGILTPAEAGYVRTGLGLLARKDEDAERKIGISITVQNELLSLGPARIAKLPMIEW